MLGGGDGLGGGELSRGLLAVHWPLEAAEAQPKRCLKSQLRHLQSGVSNRTRSPGPGTFSPVPNLEGGPPTLVSPKL